MALPEDHKDIMVPFGDYGELLAAVQNMEKDGTVHLTLLATGDQVPKPTLGDYFQLIWFVVYAALMITMAWPWFTDGLPMWWTRFYAAVGGFAVGLCLHKMLVYFWAWWQAQGQKS